MPASNYIKDPVKKAAAMKREAAAKKKKAAAMKREAAAKKKEAAANFTTFFKLEIK